jgi:hypothetical protein
LVFGGAIIGARAVGCQNFLAHRGERSSVFVRFRASAFLLVGENLFVLKSGGAEQAVAARADGPRLLRLRLENGAAPRADFFVLTFLSDG